MINKTNAQLLHEALVTGFETTPGRRPDFFKADASYVGYEEIGDFASLLRAFPMRPTYQEGDPTDDPETGLIYRPRSVESMLYRPPDSYEEGLGESRPNDEVGIEVVCRYEGGSDNAEGDFCVVKATAIAVLWSRREDDNYEVNDVGISDIELENDSLVLVMDEMRLSNDGELFYDQHFLAPYVAVSLARHVAVEEAHGYEKSPDDDPGILLGDPEGSRVRLRRGGGHVEGRYYPAEGDPVTAYWSPDPSLSPVGQTMDKVQPLADESIFYNFRAVIRGDRFNRGGDLDIYNVVREPGSQWRVRRSLAAVVGNLELIDPQ